MALFAILALVFTAVAAGAEKQWVGQEELKPDAADPGVVRFALELREPGSYQLLLTVRAEEKRQIELVLSLQPEAGGEDRTVRFSFTGAGCG